MYCGACQKVTKCVSNFGIVDEEVPADFNADEDHSPWKSMTEWLDGFLDRNKVPESSITKVKGHLQDPYDLNELHLDSSESTESMTLDIERTQLPVDSITSKDIFQKKLKATFLNEPGITETEAHMVVFGKTNWDQYGNLLNSFGTRRNNSHFKSPKILQTDMWKKGLGVVLLPNSTLVMRALTRREKEVVPLQNSTLVMFILKTSTGSEKTCQNLETRKDPILKLLGHYISNGWPCDQRQLPQDQDSYWNFNESLSVKDEIKDKGSRPVVGEFFTKSPIELRSSNDPCYSSREQLMEFYPTHYITKPFP